jgi:succinoglycan biosynthesis protein ExoA
MACRNECRAIEECLHSIFQQDYPPERFEVLLADGMSEDGTRSLLEQKFLGEPRLRIIDNPQRIVSTGLNAAIRNAHGSIIIRMDAHTRYSIDYVRQCVDVLLETGADNVGGPARTESHGLIQKSIAAAYHSPFAVGGARFHNPNFEGYVDTVTYGCWPREVFQLFGFFDEELVRNQDDEFNLRLTRRGGKIYQSPRIRSWYFPRKSLVELFLQYKQYGYWKVRVIQKHRLPASFRHVVPGVFVASLVLMPLFSLAWFPFLYGWAGMILLYLLLVLIASVATSAQNGWDLLFILAIVFPCYHLSYGWGFLRGLFDFVLFRRGSTHSAFSRLTRS